MPKKSIVKNNPKIHLITPTDSSEAHTPPAPDLAYGNSVIGSALSTAEEPTSFLGSAILNLTSEITGLVSPVQVSNQSTQACLDTHFMRDSQTASGQNISLDRLEELMMQSSGSPLPMVVAQRMEKALGHEFHNVRIHTDSAAAQAAQGISAHAFTSGRDIYFNQNTFYLSKRN